MIMIELIMMVCALASPQNCKQERLGPFAEQGLSVYSCAIKGQLRIAEWKKHNPDWVVHKYRCGKVGMFARI